jgi:hypothetical protein
MYIGLHIYITYAVSQGSSVSIVTCLGAGELRFNSLQRQISSSSRLPDRLGGSPNLLNRWVEGAFPLGGKLAQAWTSQLPSSAHVTNAWKYNSVLPYDITEWQLIYTVDKSYLHKPIQKAWLSQYSLYQFTQHLKFVFVFLLVGIAVTCVWPCHIRIHKSNPFNNCCA